MACYIMIAIIAYAIGSISSSVIISKKMAGFDDLSGYVEDYKSELGNLWVDVSHFP